MSQISSRRAIQSYWELLNQLLSRIMNSGSNELLYWWRRHHLVYFNPLSPIYIFLTFDRGFVWKHHSRKAKMNNKNQIHAETLPTRKYVGYSFHAIKPLSTSDSGPCCTLLARAI